MAKTAYVVLPLLYAFATRGQETMHLKGLAPNSDDCLTIDPLEWCTLRVNELAAKLEHARTCADLALVDELQTIIGARNNMNFGTPLRKSIWRGFEDHVCVLRNKEIVVDVGDFM